MRHNPLLELWLLLGSPVAGSMGDSLTRPALRDTRPGTSISFIRVMCSKPLLTNKKRSPPNVSAHDLVAIDDDLAALLVGVHPVTSSQQRVLRVDRLPLRTPHHEQHG